MFKALEKYAVFEGRAARSEYWLFILFTLIAGFVAGFIDLTFGTADEITGYGPFGFVTILALVVPSVAVAVRRCHDLDKSGWLILLAFIPLLNIGLAFYFAFPGTAGSNSYGENPLGKEA
jgi:uncharacterized membrane protein YhaH (DUF805 family)